MILLAIIEEIYNIDKILYRLFKQSQYILLIIILYFLDLIMKRSIKNIYR